MRADVADQLEAFVEAGALGDDQAVTTMVAQLTGPGGPTSCRRCEAS